MIGMEIAFYKFLIKYKLYFDDLKRHKKVYCLLQMKK